MRYIGPHRVTCLSVDDAGVGCLFDDGRKAEILYSDPPWGDGNVKFWATKASKDTGKAVAAISYDTLVDAFFKLIAKFVTGHVFIETGLRWEADMVERMERVGLRNLERVQLQYRSGGKFYPNVLLFGSFIGGVAALTRLEGCYGADVAADAVAPLARTGEILFDPCCGMGFSARAALRNGMEFRGNELNPVRLEKTIARLS